DASELLGLLSKDPVAPDAVDRAIPRGRDDPRAGVPRHTVPWPPLEGCRERVLDGVLGQLEVTESAGEDRDRMSPFLAEGLLDDIRHPLAAPHVTSGRISIAPCSAVGMSAASRIASSRSGRSITNKQPLKYFLSAHSRSVT